MQRLVGNHAVSGALTNSNDQGRALLPVRTGSLVPAHSMFVQRDDVAAKAKRTMKAKNLETELVSLIGGATWKEIRKRVYPKESAAGVKRAKNRKKGVLPDLTGLGSIKSLEHFAGAVRGIQAKWAALKPDDRVKELWDAANAEMTAVGVPGFLVRDKQVMDFKAFFRPSDWAFVISEALVGAASLSDADAAEVCNTTLHESRHAEQNFLAARFAAGVKKLDATAIVNSHQIPQVVADQAVAKKFDAATSAAVSALGQKMFQATVTDAAKNQKISNDDGLAELPVKQAAAQSALTAMNATITDKSIADAAAARDALRAHITFVEQMYTKYRNIPYEADAHEVGDAAEQAFRGWK